MSSMWRTSRQCGKMVVTLMSDDRNSPKHQPGGEDLLTTDEVLAELKISKPSLYKLIHQGILEPLPHSSLISRARRNYFRREDVERAKEQGQQPPKPTQD